MKSPRTVNSLVILILAIALVLTGCAKPAATTNIAPSSVSTSTQPTLSPAPSAAPSGSYGAIRMALSGFGVETFNPFKSDSTGSKHLIQEVLDNLVVAEGTGLGSGGIAEKWELSPDGLSWIYHIRKGINFQDGTALTGKDVKYSLDGYIGKDSFYSYLRDLTDRVELTDDYTVRIYTKGPQPDLPWYASTATPSSGVGLIVPKDYVERNGMDYFEHHPMGSGPWKFSRHIAGDMAEYEAVDKHWRQTPQFKTFTVILMPEETTRIASLKTQAADAIDIDLESVAPLESAGYKTQVLDPESAFVLLHGAYQSGAGPIADVRVRQALSLAINRDELQTSLFFGKAGPPGPPFSSGTSTGFDLSYWMDYAKKAYRYDMEESKRLLKDAGYANGFSLELWTMPKKGGTYLPKLAEILQSYWMKIGIKTSIVITDDATYKKHRSTLKSNELIGKASTGTYSAGPLTPKNNITGFHSTMGNYTMVGKAMPELDKLLEQTSSEIDSTKRKALIEKAFQIEFDSWTTLMIGAVPYMTAVGPRVDITFTKPAGDLPWFAASAKHKK
jgi:peptide/nickel transport system substrate-binding protein